MAVVVPTIGQILVVPVNDEEATGSAFTVATADDLVLDTHPVVAIRDWA